MSFIQLIGSILKGLFVTAPRSVSSVEARPKNTSDSNYERIRNISKDIIQMEPEIRMLIVDDNRDSRDILTKLMQMSGFEAVSAVDGVQALELVAKQKFHLVITDINMPRLNGIELIKRLKRERTTAHIPVLAITAYGSVAGREAVDAGAEAFAEKKTLEFDKLLEMVKLIIARSSPTLMQEDKGPEPNLIVPIKKSIALVNERLAHHFQNDPEALRRIDPFTFEKVVAELFEDDGYEVILTPQRADGGKDIYVYKKDPITNLMFMVECKRYTPPNKVSVETARQLYGVVQQERANAGIIVTTSYFTKPAKDFANGVPYQLFLRDFDYLSQWLNKKK